MIETGYTSGFCAAGTVQIDGSAEEDPGPSCFYLLIEAEGWRTLAGVELAVRRAYEATAARLDAIADREVSILLSSDAAVAALNGRYRGKAKPTNVLSFPAAVSGTAFSHDREPLVHRSKRRRQPEFGKIDAKQKASARKHERSECVSALGDIIIAYETVIREAGEDGRPPLFHLSHLTVHGLLHLAGFDHETEAEADRMEAMERHILASIGIPDPYSSTAAETPAQAGL